MALERVEGLIADARARGDSADSLEILRASALLRLGLAAEAEAVLAPLAARYPGAGRVQLDHAFALFLLRRDEEARSILRRVGRATISRKPVRRNIEDLLAEIRARAKLRVDLDVSLWHDTNVNNAPEIETIGIPFGGSTLAAPAGPATRRRRGCCARARTCSGGANSCRTTHASRCTRRADSLDPRRSAPRNTAGQQYACAGRSAAMAMCCRWGASGGRATSAWMIGAERHWWGGGGDSPRRFGQVSPHGNV